jgi:hypothetical protein
MLMAYLRVLEANGKRVLVDSPVRFYAHPLHPHDRIQVWKSAAPSDGFLIGMARISTPSSSALRRAPA